MSDSIRFFVVWGMSSVWLVEAFDEAGACAKVDRRSGRAGRAHLRARPARPEDVRRLQAANGSNVPVGAERWAEGAS